MRYYLDCEFNGFGGELISLALVSQALNSLYLTFDIEAEPGEWVKANVLPILETRAGMPRRHFAKDQREEAATAIAAFLASDPRPHIISDWPADIEHLCRLLHFAPGLMPQTAPAIDFTVTRADAYPTRLEGAIQHNAWWDAMALCALLEPGARLADQ